MSREAKWTAAFLGVHVVAYAAWGIWLAVNVGGTAAPQIFQLTVYVEFILGALGFGLWCAGRWAWRKLRPRRKAPAR